MTTTKMRRGKRSLAAILAAMLMASVLAVVAGSPAQAANTASEVLLDHDGNASTAMVRQFAGQDRYDTALRVAKDFAEEKGGLGAVPTAFLASGVTLVDSISAAGFAGYADAPILLTRGDSLHGGVADFIEDYGAGTVYVLGGTAAISDATVTAIEGLANSPKVTRLDGTDRYATAARIAGQIETDSQWCGTDAVSAVLINGGTDMLAYGVAVQTAVYRLQLPLLMTTADELPDSTADYITENDVEHVQIVGSTDVVSAGVESALTSLGVDTVARVDGASAAAVSVELAKMANNGCNDDLAPVSGTHVALVRGNPDGVVAAPALASSIVSGSMVTPLVVNEPMDGANSLPASVRDYLAATPKANAAGTKLNLRIVAIGGMAAVSQATMDAAIDAAASSGALTVTIGAGDAPGDTTLQGDSNGDGVTNTDDVVRPQTANGAFALYFSDDVTSGTDATTGDGAALTAKLRDMIEVNGIPASVTSAVTGAAGGGCAKNVVYVTLSQPLAAGDTISVVSSAHKLGTGSDQRTVAPASATVEAAAPDRTRPSVTIIGIAGPDSAATIPGAAAFTVRISDAGGLAADTLTAEDFTYSPGTGSGNTKDATLTVAGAGATIAADPVAKMTTFTVSVPTATPLVAGDRLMLKAGAVKDVSGNMNAARSGTAIKAQASPKITSVLMSSLKHSAHNVWTLPAEAADSTTAAGAANAVTITAKGDGDAAGAAGNAWTIVFDTSSTYDAAKPKDIDVRVDTKSKRVTVRFVNGPNTVQDLVAALAANTAFDSRFAATLPCSDTTTARLAVSNANRNVLATPTNAGRTQFAIEVGFNAYIHTVDAEAHSALLEDLLAAAATRAKVLNTDAGIRAEAAGAVRTVAGGGLSLVSSDQTALPGTGGLVPTKKVRNEGETALAGLLPQARDLVVTTAGAGVLGDDPNTDDTETDFRDEAQEVAVGYAEDDTTSTAKAKVDQSMNAGGQTRIAVSSSVKAPA